MSGWDCMGKTVERKVSDDCYDKIHKRMEDLGILTKSEYFQRLLRIDLEFGGLINEDKKYMRRYGSCGDGKLWDNVNEKKLDYLEVLSLVND